MEKIRSAIGFGTYLATANGEFREEVYNARWSRTSASLLGLPKQEVTYSQFIATLSGCDWRTGVFLKTRRTRACGWELDLAVGKEVSLTAMANPAVLNAVGESFSELAELIAALATARPERPVGSSDFFAFLSSVVCRPDLRKSGGLCAYAVHRFSRENDPQIHSHFIIPNLAYSEERKRWCPADVSFLFENYHFLVQYLAGLVAAKLSALGFSLTARAFKTYTAFVPSGLSESLVRRFSKRSEQIRTKLSELKWTLKDASSYAAAKGVTFLTRSKKSHLSELKLTNRFFAQLTESELLELSKASVPRQRRTNSLPIQDFIGGFIQTREQWQVDSIELAREMIRVDFASIEYLRNGTALRGVSTILRSLNGWWVDHHTASRVNGIIEFMQSRPAKVEGGVGQLVSFPRHTSGAIALLLPSEKLSFYGDSSLRTYLEGQRGYTTAMFANFAVNPSLSKGCKLWPLPRISEYWDSEARKQIEKSSRIELVIGNLAELQAATQLLQDAGHVRTWVVWISRQCHALLAELIRLQVPVHSILTRGAGSRISNSSIPTNVPPLVVSGFEQRRRMVVDLFCECYRQGVFCQLVTNDRNEPWDALAEANKRGIRGQTHDCRVWHGISSRLAFSAGPLDHRILVWAAQNCRGLAKGTIGELLGAGEASLQIRVRGEVVEVSRNIVHRLAFGYAESLPIAPGDWVQPTQRLLTIEGRRLVPNRGYKIQAINSEFVVLRGMGRLANANLPLRLAHYQTPYSIDFIASNAKHTIVNLTSSELRNVGQSDLALELLRVGKVFTDSLVGWPMLQPKMPTKRSSGMCSQGPSIEV